MKNRIIIELMALFLFILILATAPGNVAIAYYGGMYGGYGMYGELGMMGMYGGYMGMPTLGLGSLYNPLSYYSYGSGMFSPFYHFDPLSDSLLGLGMFAGALI